MLLRRTWRIAALSAAAVVLAGCANGPAADAPIRLGWLGGDLPPLDPAASDTVAAFSILDQIYPSLLTIEAGEPDPVLDLAESAAFTADKEYTVTIPRGVTFANGNDLTSSDVVFSVQRQLDLQEDELAGREFDGLESVEAVDDTTIVFRLRSAVDTGFPYVLAGPGGLIVDEESFFADAITPDEDIIAAQAFGGPFTLERSRGATKLVPFEDHVGARSALSTLELVLGDPDDLAGQLREGGVDVLTGRFPADVLADLRDDDALEFTRAASGRVRLLAFDIEHMPFGTRSDAPDAAKAIAVRQAIADLVDRDELVDEVGANRVARLDGYLPSGLLGVTTPFDTLRGDGEGGPDAARAAETLQAAGITTPVPLTVHVVPDWNDGVSAAEAETLAAQLTADDLFDVTVVETDAEGLAEARIDGDVAAVLTSVLAPNADPASYLGMFRTGGSLATGFTDGTVDSLLARERGEVDPAVRGATLGELQSAIAAQLPAIPLTQNERTVFARSGIEGVRLDDSVIFDLTTVRR